jgi:hypothetical protein
MSHSLAPTALPRPLFPTHRLYMYRRWHGLDRAPQKQRWSRHKDSSYFKAAEGEGGGGKIEQMLKQAGEASEPNQRALQACLHV